MQETTHFYKVKFFVANSTNFYEVLSFEPEQPPSPQPHARDGLPITERAKTNEINFFTLNLKDGSIS